MDTWWQTETGRFMITPLPVVPLKPGSATRPSPAWRPMWWTSRASRWRPNEEGYLVHQDALAGHAAHHLRRPRPLREAVLEQVSGPVPHRRLGQARRGRLLLDHRRVDDVIKVSGYRLGTAEIESALVSHPAVAEAAAIGLPHEIKGNAIHAFVISGAPATNAVSEKLAEELRQHVGHELGPIAKPEKITFVPSSPRRAAARSCARCWPVRG
jgi:acetyl-CoA synthetase